MTQNGPTFGDTKITFMRDIMRDIMYSGSQSPQNVANIIHWAYEVLGVATRREICENIQNHPKSALWHCVALWRSSEVKKPSSTQKMQHTPLQTPKKRVKCAKYDCLAVRGPGSGYKARNMRKYPKSPQIRTLALCGTVALERSQKAI